MARFVNWWNRIRRAWSRARCYTMTSRRTAPLRVGRTTTTNASSTTTRPSTSPLSAVSRRNTLQRQPTARPPVALQAKNTFFLILYEIGLEDRDVRRIMGITQEAIRSTRYRIMQNGKK